MHPIVEIRVRALSSLLQKVQLNLVSISRLGQHSSFLSNLLQLLKLGPHNLRSQVLELLFFVFKDDSTRRQFASLGGTQYLHNLKAVAPLELLPDINILLQKLHHCSSETSKKPTSRTPEFSQPQVEDTSQHTENICSLTGPHVVSGQEMCGSVDGDQSMENFCDVTTHDHHVSDREPPVTFTTFPWQALTSSDRQVLDSIVQSLLSCHEGVVIASLHFLNTVVLKDFPPEILLQRPAIVKAVYGCIGEGENSWRVQTPGCNCLLTLTQMLNTRVKHFTDPHMSPGNEQQMVTPVSSGMISPSGDITRGSCCSSRSNNMQGAGANGHALHTKGSNEGFIYDGQDRRGSVDSVIQELSSTTIHEEDDEDEFILLGMHQLTVTGHCSHIMRVVCPLLMSSRSAVQAASLHLLTACLTLLQQCVNPSLLWKQDNDDDEVALEVAEEIRRVCRQLILHGLQLFHDLTFCIVNPFFIALFSFIFQIIICLSHLMLANFEAKKLASLHAEAEKYVQNIHCLALVLCKVLKDFLPVEVSPQVIDGDVSEGMIHALCDGGFYLEHKDQYSILLQYLSQARPTSGNQIECILFAAKSLQATSSFLQTASSQVEQFLDLAGKAVQVSTFHKSTLLVEKLVRGLAKQIAQGNLNEDQLSRARNLILEVFNFPDVAVRLDGYKSVLRLVEDSVGISQASDTSMSRSPKILLLLSPTVIRYILYCGLTDDNEEVVKLAKDIIHGLLLGRPLMSSPVWAVAVECWRMCLTNIQCLSEPSTSLGRAVITLPSFVYEDDNTLQNIEILKYQLQCLYVRNKETRIQALSQVLHRLTLNATTFLPDRQDYQLEIHHDLFIVKQPLHLFLMSNMVSEEGQLVKVLELIQGRGVESGVRKAAWCQLAFLLEDPKLHPPFLQLCSLQYLVMSFVTMLKRDGTWNMTVEFLPSVVETLRLLVTYSTDIRKALLQDQEFLLCIVRVALLFYADNRTRYQASCLMALLIFSDIIRFSTVEGQKQVAVVAKDFVAVPELLVSKVVIPFICDTYLWHEKSGLCREMRKVHQILEEKDWEVLNFLKAVWAAACVGGIEHIDLYDDLSSQLSLNLSLQKFELALLNSSVLKTVMTKLLKNILNATSHQDVKRNVDTLSFYIQQVQFASCKNEDFFSSANWNQSLHRFIISQPTSSVDEQLLIHVMNLVSISLLVYRPILKNGIKLCPPLVLFLLNELQEKDSAIHHTLQRSGTVNWMASNPDPQALLSVRLFSAITKVIGHVFKFLHCCLSAQDDFDNVSLNKLASCITQSLLPLFPANNDLQYYNLAVLGCALECLVHVTALAWPGDELSHQLISDLIKLTSTFHIGRGRAHNSYMGRMITLYSSLALVHLLSHPSIDLTQAVRTWPVGDGVLDCSWLVSLWVYRDHSIISAGLNIAATLATQASGQSLLHDSLTQVSGGIWGAALSYLLSSDQSCLVRTSAAKVLIKLTRNGPTSRNPWISPVVADSLTGESVEGLPALMVLLQHCNFYSVLCSVLARLCVSQEHLTVETQPINQGELYLSVSQLSSFYTSANDIPNTVGGQKDIKSHGSTSPTVSVQLYETVLRLLVNILLLKPSEVILQLFSHDIITLIVKQLQIIISHINTSEIHVQATEAALVLIGAVLKFDGEKAPLLARDTSLIHLTLVVLCSASERTNISVASLEVLNALVCGGGWGAAQVVQWIAVSPSLTLRPILDGLHSSASHDLQVAVVSFLTNVLQSVFQSEISSQEDLPRTISGALDVPVPLLNDQNICPGWELSRHLIQLICSLPDLQEMGKQALEKQKTKDLVMEQQHLFLFLNCFKLLLLVSESAKEAAHHLQHFLLPVLTKPLSDLQEKLRTINIHITSHLLKNKEIQDDVQTVIQNLGVATNWVHGRGRWVEIVGKSIVPLLHPLWVPALNTPSLLEAILRFILTASAHHQVCLILTRTSGLPGVLLSTSRSKRPLLALITTLVCQQLVKLLTCNRNFNVSFKDISRDSILSGISILINCARLQVCASVMNKLDLISYLMKWLACKIAFKEGMIITTSILKLLIFLTTYHESRIAICRSNGWISIIYDLVAEGSLQKDALRIMGNMSLNHHSVQSVLASDDFIKTLINIVGKSGDEQSTELALVNLWALIANNQRGQAIIKQHPFQPLLKNIIETQGGKAASISQKILDMIR
ncbi:rotatin-like isoform X2 [Panulirus ornatus]|uniref:rotatin-like isoform X2 n=1 Tax=Panulirus ornatus TaxID=150431 RepID=UPI003A83D955